MFHFGKDGKMSDSDAGSEGTECQWDYVIWWWNVQGKSIREEQSEHKSVWSHEKCGQLLFLSDQALYLITAVCLIFSSNLFFSCLPV